MSRIVPVKAHLFTWEVSTNFDENLSPKELESSFATEFPETCSRLNEMNPPGYFVIWPLIAFNASEGRLSRYLVAIVESQPENISAKLLPRQIWRYALADNSIRNVPVDMAGNSGNYMCYGIDEDAFYMMVFFEGRLCHWAEENRISTGEESFEVWLENRLERIRNFLKKDPLFSRAESFVEIPLEESFDEHLFKAASKDPFWKKWNLQKEKEARPRSRSIRLNKRCCKWLFLVAFPFALILLKGHLLEFSYDVECMGCTDALPVELDLPPQLLEVSEMRNLDDGKPAKNELQKPLPPIEADASPSCILPRLRVNGLVAEKVAILALGESHGMPQKTLAASVGDSLGNFMVASVGRDRVVLQCRDSVVEKGVGESVP